MRPDQIKGEADQNRMKPDQIKEKPIKTG